MRGLHVRVHWIIRRALLRRYKPKKIYGLKEDQAFSLLLELGRREKVERHRSADFLLHSIGGGGDFVDTVIAVKML
jgi:hypothetical protein